MLDDGYPVWSFDSPNDAYWNLAVGNPSSQVEQWFQDCINNPIASMQHPNFADGFDGWVQANNWIIRNFGNKSSTKVAFGWQDNMWAVNSGFWVNSNTDLSLDQIKSTYATPVINWLSANAPSTISSVAGNPAPDFFTFDRYEFDDSAAPGQGTLYNAHSWTNYLHGVGLISKAFDNIPVMMWQIPGGHLPYNGEKNPELLSSGGYIFGSAPDYFLGDINLGVSLANLIMGSADGTINQAVGAYSMPSDYNCPGCNYKQYLLSNNYDWSKDNGNLHLAAENNVFVILWGGGNTTNVIKNFSNPSDHGWLAQRVKDYYKAPQKLNPAP